MIPDGRNTTPEPYPKVNPNYWTSSAVCTPFYRAPRCIPARVCVSWRTPNYRSSLRTLGRCISIRSHYILRIYRGCEVRRKFQSNRRYFWFAHNGRTILLTSWKYFTPDRVFLLRWSSSFTKMTSTRELSSCCTDLRRQDSEVDLGLVDGATEDGASVENGTR